MPFKITEVVTVNSSKLNIPASFGVSDVFNVSKLRLFIPNTFIDRTPDTPAPVLVAGQEERFVHSVLTRKASRGRRRRDGTGNWMCLIQWAGERQDQAT